MEYELTQNNFDELVTNNCGIALVDFWAAWCGPWKMLSPVVDQIAEENPDIKVGKVDVDDQVELAMKYQIMSIPTLLVFKNGELANQSVGVIPKQAILNLVK